MFANVDGVVPYGKWFEEAAKYVVLRYYQRSDVPATLNGHGVSVNAHVSDFYRVKVGGLFTDMC